MSDVQEQILDAVKILADNAVSASNATITIECKIIEVIDAGVGLYKVEYKANKFECYSSNPSIVYNIDDTVYVIVPDGDFDKNKTIIGAVAPVASMYVETEKVDNYIPISENLIREREVIKLSTYHTRSESIDPPNPIIIDNPVIDDFKLLFPDYLKTYNTYLFSAKIKTNIELSQQVQGNYGLKLSLPIISNDKQVENYYKDIILDVSNIEGSPYRLTEYSLQNIYFELPEDTVYDDSRNPILIAFVENFPEQKEEIDPIPAEDINIWIKDITLKAVDVLTVENKEGYYLSLVSDKGNYFLEGDGFTTKTLSPVLKIKGKNTSVKNYDCYWFLEDASVDTTSDDYTTIGGLGWRCLNTKTNVSYTEEGKMTFQYVTNVYELKVTNEDVYGSSKYKCVLTRNNVVISGSLVLHNFQSNIHTELVSATGSNDFIKDTGYITLISKVKDSSYDPATMQMKTAWQRFDKNGNFYIFTEGEDGFEVLRLNDLVGEYYETEIRFRSSLVEDLNLITCSVYNSKLLDNEIKEYILGTNSIVVTTSDNFVYRVAIQNGDVLYKYDADGDSPMIADYDGPISSRISATKPISYRIFKADGLELSETEYLYCDTEWHVPVNSMIIPNDKSHLEEYGRYYIITDKELYYTISSTYNVKKNDNTIVLNLKLPDADLSENIDIKFLKDGESGTNGGRYSGLITFDNYYYGQKKRKLQFLCVHKNNQNDTWYHYHKDKNGKDQFYRYAEKTPTGIPTKEIPGLDFPYFSVDVYRDGEKITNSSKKNYDVEWSIFDDSVTNPILEYNTNTEYFILKVGNWSNPDNMEYCTTIQAKITIYQKADAEIKAENQILYAYYPIEVSYVDNPASDDFNYICNFVGGFDKVLYASDGTNPKYDNSNDFTLNLNIEEEKYQRKYTWKVSSNFTQKPYGTYESQGTIQEIDDKCTVRPVSKYDSGESKNFVKVTMNGVDSSNVIYQDAETKLAEQQNKKDNCVAEKTKLESNDIQNSLNEFCNNVLNIETCKSAMSGSKNIINNRYNGIVYMNQLVVALQDLDTYCNTCGIDSDNFNILYLTGLIQKYKGIVIQTYTQEGQIQRFVDLGKDDNHNLNWLSGYPIDSVGSAEDLLDNVLVSRTKFKKKYVSAYAKMFSIATTISNLDGKYQSCYNTLISKTSEESNYNILIKTLRQTYDGTGAAADSFNKLIAADATTFNQIKSRFEIIVNTFFTEQASYTFIENSIINNINGIVKDFASNYYSTFYGNKIDALTAEIKVLEKEIEDYNKILDSFKIKIIHIKPILLLYNRYEMTNLNGWDGNKLYTGSDPNNSAFLLAPQIGAGTKEENAFTGMIMGLRNLNKANTQTQIGLFGYNKGIQTLFLNSRDGSAILGKSGNGQIIIDPSSSVNKALIYSSNYFSQDGYNDDGKPKNYSVIGKGTNGLLLNLTDAYIHFGSQNGYIYSGNHNSLTDTNNTGFYLSQKGLSINGEYQSGGETLKSHIGISTDGDPKIYSGGHNSLNSKKNGFYLGNDGLSIGERVFINKDGLLRLGQGAYNNSGKHWTINYGIEKLIASYIGDVPQYYTKPVHSYIAFGNEKSRFYTTEDTDEAGGGVHFAADISATADKNTVYLGTDGIRLGAKFVVDYNGNMIATNADIRGKITATSGKIGNWEIENGNLKTRTLPTPTKPYPIYTLNLDADKIYATQINATGTQTTWSINRNGTATFNGKITCSNLEVTGGSIKIGNFYISGTEGTIGGWNIGQNAIYRGNVSMHAGDGNEGYIQCNNLYFGGTSIFDDGNVLGVGEKCYIHFKKNNDDVWEIHYKGDLVKDTDS